MTDGPGGAPSTQRCSIRLMAWFPAAVWRPATDARVRGGRLHPPELEAVEHAGGRAGGADVGASPLDRSTDAAFLGGELSSSATRAATRATALFPMLALGATAFRPLTAPMAPASDSLVARIRAQACQPTTPRATSVTWLRGSYVESHNQSVQSSPGRVRLITRRLHALLAGSRRSVRTGKRGLEIVGDPLGPARREAGGWTCPRGRESNDV